MGCDEPAPKDISLMMGNVIETTRVCPRRLMRNGVPYLRAFNWHKAGNLGMMYPKEMPATVAEAIDLLETEQGKLIEHKGK